MSREAGRKKTIRIGKRTVEHWQIIEVLLAVYDYVAVCAAYFLALFFRFDGVFSSIPQEYIDPYSRFIFPFAGGSILIFLAFRMYNSMWRSASGMCWAATGP